MPFVHSMVARAFLAAASVVFLVASASVAPARAAEVKLETESYTIPSGDPGIDLYIRHKHPAGLETFTPDKILLYVHGATYPSETAFDLPIEGVSMMDLIAARGYDVYLVDVRGYGRSTRPAEMSQPPSATCLNASLKPFGVVTLPSSRRMQPSRSPTRFSGCNTSSLSLAASAKIASRTSAEASLKPGRLS